MNFDAVSVQVSADPTVSSEAEMTFQKCSRLNQGNWAFVPSQTDQSYDASERGYGLGRGGFPRWRFLGGLIIEGHIPAAPPAAGR